MTNSQEWFSQDIENIAKAFDVDINIGLSSEQATIRLQRDGINQIPQGVRFSVLKAIFRQLINPIALVLIFAAAATIFLHEYIDAIVVVLALFINITIGTLQEGKSAKIFETLENAQEKNATVIRDGAKQTVLSRNLVEGDIVILESGFAVPADVRLIRTDDVLINESALTGEADSVEKDAKQRPENGSQITELSNMAWMSTIILAGTAKGIVVGTGARAEIGQISEQTNQEQNRQTALQISIRRIANMMIIIILLIITAIVVLGLMRGEILSDMLLLAIAIAVAAIPQGLPAAVTVVLALGMERILKTGGLVKNLMAAETLGSTTVILTDKTGTLTRGEMLLSGLYTYQGIKNKSVESTEDNSTLLTMAVLASDAYVEFKDGKKVASGRPVEKSIIEAGIKADILQSELFEAGNERLDFARFDPSRRYGASLNVATDKTNHIYITGSPEHILALSDTYFFEEGVQEIKQEIIDSFRDTQDRLSSEGYRFTAIAYMSTQDMEIGENITKPSGEKIFTFVGLLAFEDALRDDVSDAIAKAQGAGVHVIMATGDHAATAQTIAERTGIASLGSIAVTGAELSNMNDSELKTALKENTIFARVLPKQKLRIVKLLQDQNEVVAMTGDGINDAPALAAADIGLAVGSGTDVAKNAADLILMKDSFSIITSAIAEGRRIIDNIKKIVAYLLSTSLSEVVLISGSLAVGAPLPVLPAQILWANIVEEGLMSFPFAFEPREKGALNRKPSSSKTKRIISQQMKRFLTITSIFSGALLLSVYALLSLMDNPIEHTRTVMFLAISVDSIFAALAYKNLKKPFWKTKILSNKQLIYALLGSIVILLLAIVWSPLKTLLSLDSLYSEDYVLIFIIGLLNLAVIEIAKYFTFAREK